MVAYASKPSTREAEARGSLWVPGQSGLQWDLVSKETDPKTNQTTKPNFQHPVSYTKNYISVSLGLRTLHCSMSGKSASENNLHPTLQAHRCNKEWKPGCKKLTKGVGDFSLFKTRNSADHCPSSTPTPISGTSTVKTGGLRMLYCRDHPLAGPMARSEFSLLNPWSAYPAVLCFLHEWLMHLKVPTLGRASGG